MTNLNEDIVIETLRKRMRDRENKTQLQKTLGQEYYMDAKMIGECPKIEDFPKWHLQPVSESAFFLL